tara:strand:+ start:124 stop:417 length:294 start_codon:yes stop_codon:yes gene_type:complete
MAKKKKRKTRFIGIIDIIDLVLNFIPQKAAVPLLLLTLTGGYMYGFSTGVDSVEIPTFPECPTCPEAETCPEIECPVCKNLSDYTCKEIFETRPDCF